MHSLILIFLKINFFIKLQSNDHLYKHTIKFRYVKIYKWNKWNETMKIHSLSFPPFIYINTYTVFKRSRNLLINLYVLRHTHLFSYMSIFLLILCVGNTYKPYKSVFNNTSLGLGSPSGYSESKFYADSESGFRNFPSLIF